MGPAENRIQAVNDRVRADQLAALNEENRLLREHVIGQSRHIVVLEALLAVIYRFVKLPLPVKTDWDKFQRTATTRLERIRYATRETGMDAAKRWTDTLNEWILIDLDYSPDSATEPKPVVERTATTEPATAAGEDESR